MDSDPPQDQGDRPDLFLSVLFLSAPALLHADTLADEPGLTGASETGSLFLLLAGAIILNALLTMAQMAAASLGQDAASRLRQRKDPPARLAKPFVSKLGILEQQFARGAQFLLILGVMVASVVGIRVVPGHIVTGVLAGIIVMFLVQLVIVEAVARNLALRNPVRYFVALVPMAWLISLPARLLLIPSHLFSAIPRKGTVPGGISDMHLRLLPTMKGIERVVDEEAFEMIDSVRDFAETPAEEIMTPRTEVEAIALGLPVEEVFERLRCSEYSRVVVYRDTIDNVVGTLLAKEVLLQRPADPWTLLRQPLFAGEDTRLPELLRLIRANRSHLVVILDEYGGMSGIVTLHDLFEVIVGHMEDVEDEEELWIERVDDETWRLNGRVEVWELNEELGLSLDEEPARTVGGLVLHVLGRVPEEGVDVEVDGVRLTVREVRGNRVEVLEMQLAVNRESPAFREVE